MTERHAGYVITLDQSIREDDAEQILTALRQIRGVASVTPVADSIDVQIGEQRALAELRSRLHEVLWERRR